MNRNVESHFSHLPSVDVQRSVFDRSSSHKTTFNAGDLIPIYLDEVLPGDTFQMTTSKVVRMQTLLTPIMDNLYLDTYFFFVPNRLVWDHWEEFCGENKTGPWVQQVERFVPTITSPSGGFASGTIADYMGIPVGLEFGEGADMRLPSALPFRAYALICDQYFRDENLSDPLNIPKGDAVTQGVNVYDPVSGAAAGGLPYKAAKYHDYFTSCLPSPQKGDPVNIINQFRMPVVTGEQLPASTILAAYGDGGASGQTMSFGKASLSSGGVIGVESLPLNRYLTSGSSYVASSSGGSPTKRISNEVLASEQPSTTSWTQYPLTPTNLWTFPDSSISLNVNDLRLAFQLQRFYEKSARSGTRYIEILLGQFGVSSPDARLQRAEYLGGNRIPIQIHEVTNQAQGDIDFLGDLGAMSQTSDVHEDFAKSFTEHGYVIGLAVARYDHSYSQGFEKHWFRHKFTDFYLPVFANIGEQPVYQSEIYATAENMKRSGHVFGYQEAWSEYRYKPSRISGEMRPGIPNSLASWHLADYYNVAPTLSDGWIREDKTNVDRTLAVTSQLSNQFFADFYFNCRVTRPMPMFSIPGLIDHN